MNHVTDKKLSAKERDKLPDSAFCGPDRSFPANDCGHVRAGLSLLGRYKGPGDKDKIRACLYRKAKSLGCFKSQKDGRQAEDTFATIDTIREFYLLAMDGFISDKAEGLAVLVQLCSLRNFDAEKTKTVISSAVNDSIVRGFEKLLGIIE